MKKISTLTLNRKRWRLRYVPRLGKAGKGDDGSCDAPTDCRKEIKIRCGLSPQDEFETLIHEMLHACTWPLDESHVTQTAHDIARALWRIGYRKEPQT